MLYRNSKKELNDIRFEFAVGKDSADGIASELVGAGLVDSRDMAAITNNLQKLVESRENLKVVTFPLVCVQCIKIEISKLKFFIAEFRCQQQ